MLARAQEGETPAVVRKHWQKSTGDKRFYRFDKPTTDGYPFMLELFSRAPDQLDISDDAQLTPIPANEEISSLSAVLLDEDYYQCIQKGH